MSDLRIDFKNILDSSTFLVTDGDATLLVILDMFGRRSVSRLGLTGLASFLAPVQQKSKGKVLTEILDRYYFSLVSNTSKSQSISFKHLGFVLEFSGQASQWHIMDRRFDMRFTVLDGSNEKYKKI